MAAFGGAVSLIGKDLAICGIHLTMEAVALVTAACSDGNMDAHLQRTSRRTMVLLCRTCSHLKIILGDVEGHWPRSAEMFVSKHACMSLRKKLNEELCPWS